MFLSYRESNETLRVRNVIARGDLDRHEVLLTYMHDDVGANDASDHGEDGAAKQKHQDDLSSPVDVYFPE